jgi:hypothetical protein
MTTAQTAALAQFLQTYLVNTTVNNKVTRENLNTAFITLMTQLNDSKAEVIDGLIDPLVLPQAPLNPLHFIEMGATQVYDIDEVGYLRPLIAQMIADAASPNPPASGYPPGHTAINLFTQGGLEGLYDASLGSEPNNVWVSPYDNNAGATTRLMMSDGDEVAILRTGVIDPESNENENGVIGTVDNYARGNNRGIGLGPDGLYLIKEGDGIFELLFDPGQQVAIGERACLRFDLASHNLLVFKITSANVYTQLTIPGGNLLDGINDNSFVQMNINAHLSRLTEPSGKGLTVNTVV